MEAHPRFKLTELLPSNLIFQDGDTRDHPTLPSKRGVGDFSGFQQRLLPYPNRTKVVEIPQILPPQSSLSVHSSPLWPLNSSVGVHKGGKGSQINGTGSGYQDPPVPRRLVAESPLPGNVPTSYPDPLGPMPQVRVGSQYDQVGVGASAGIQLCRLPFRPLSRSRQTDPGEVDSSVPKDQRPPQSTGVFGQTVHVPYRATNSHREAGSSRSAPHAPYPVASEEALACPGIIREDYSSKLTELLPSNLIFQDGDTRDHPTLPSKRGVGDFSGFQQRLLPYPNRTKVVEIPQILPPQSSLSVHSSPLWPLNSSVGVHKGGKGSQINGTGSGYQDPPVPRRLVAESPLPGNVPTSYPDPLGPMPQVRVGSQYDQVGVGASAGIQLCRLPFRPLSRSRQTDPGEVDSSVPKDQRPPQSTGVFGQTVHVPYRATNSHREAGSSRSAPHAPYPVASEEALACPGIIREDYSSTTVPSSTPEVVVEPRQCPKRPTFTPIATRSSTVYRRLKRRLGCSLRRLHSKRPLVHARKRLAYKLAGAQGRFTSPKTVRAVVLEPDDSGVFRQHDSGLLHKQGGRYEIRLSLYSSLEAADVVQPQADGITGQAYSSPPQCHCGQVVPTRSGDTNGMVPPPGGLRPDLQEMAQAGSRPFCDQVQS